MPNNCARCGAPLPPNCRSSRVWCDDCRVLVKREREHASRERKKSLRGPQPRPASPGGYSGTGRAPRIEETAEQLRGSPFDLAGKSLGRLAAEARFLKLSYGEYVAMCQNGTIRQHLRRRGIGDPDGLMKKFGGEQT